MSSLHLHETASLGLRGARLTGAGTEHGRLIRLILLSATRWPGRESQDPWHSNAKLAKMSGLEERQVEIAVSCLRRAGVIATRRGPRPGAKPGRLIAMGLHAPVKALVPSGFDLRNLWAVLRAHRSRPAALVTMVVGAFMLASDAAGEAIDEWSLLGCSANALRRFIGQADGPSWTARLRELERLGLLRREGRKVFVSPPRAWFSLAVDAAERSVAEDVRLDVHDELVKPVLNVARAPLDRLKRIEIIAVPRVAEQLASLEHEVTGGREQHGRGRRGGLVGGADGAGHLAPSNLIIDVGHMNPNSTGPEVFPDAGIIAGRIGTRAREPADYALPLAPLLRVRQCARVEGDAAELQTGTGDVVARSRGRPT